MSTDSLKWHPSITVAKFNPETVADITRKLGHRPTAEDYARITPDEIVTADGNELTTAGLSRIANLIIGTASTPAFSGPSTGAKGLIGVGNGTAAFGAGQTDLQGASKFFAPITGTPSVSGGAFTASTLFLAAEANFAWEEWCFAIGTGTTVKNAALATAGGGSAVMLNRKVQTLGTKASGAEWTLTATVTLS